MKKILTLIPLTFLIFSCVKMVKNTVSQKKEPVEIRVSEDFIQGSEDIPLLLGMNKIFDDSLGFDSSSGSIMTSSYETKIDLERVKNFYHKTLPQMGWKLVSSDIAKSKFKRGKEKLEIDFVNQNGKDIVRFFLSSAI
jgi:imidazoleglycerol phosphate synthase glutamine amidotransferase subunit HisH